VFATLRNTFSKKKGNEVGNMIRQAGYAHEGDIDTEEDFFHGVILASPSEDGTKNSIIPTFRRIVKRIKGKRRVEMSFPDPRTGQPISHDHCYRITRSP